VDHRALLCGFAKRAVPPAGVRAGQRCTRWKLRTLEGARDARFGKRIRAQLHRDRACPVLQPDERNGGVPRRDVILEKADTRVDARASAKRARGLHLPALSHDPSITDIIIFHSANRAYNTRDRLRARGYNRAKFTSTPRHEGPAGFFSVTSRGRNPLGFLIHGTSG